MSSRPSSAQGGRADFPPPARDALLSSAAGIFIGGNPVGTVCMVSRIFGLSRDQAGVVWPTPPPEIMLLVKTNLGCDPRPPAKHRQPYQAGGSKG